MIIAGFVEGTNPAPGTVLVSIESLLTHLEATKEPYFWDDKRTARYRAAVKG